MLCYCYQLLYDGAQSYVDSCIIDPYVHNINTNDDISSFCIIFPLARDAIFKKNKFLFIAGLLQLIQILSLQIHSQVQFHVRIDKLQKKLPKK